MDADVATRLDEIVRRLERDGEVTAACGLKLATKLLQMARLELLCQIHEISDAELDAFTDRLSAKPAARNGTLVYLADRKRGGAMSRR